MSAGALIENNDGDMLGTKGILAIIIFVVIAGSLALILGISK